MVGASQSPDVLSHLQAFMQLLGSYHNQNLIAVPSQGGISSPGASKQAGSCLLSDRKLSLVPDLKKNGISDRGKKNTCEFLELFFPPF